MILNGGVCKVIHGMRLGNKRKTPMWCNRKKNKIVGEKKKGRKCYDLRRDHNIVNPVVKVVLKNKASKKKIVYHRLRGKKLFYLKDFVHSLPKSAA